jgi:protein TonB
MAGPTSSVLQRPRLHEHPDDTLEEGLGTPLRTAGTAALAALDNAGREITWRHYAVLGGVVILLHAGAGFAYRQFDHDTPLSPQPRKVEIEFIKPVVEPPKEVEPPPPPPPPPPKPKVVKRETPPPPKPAPAPALRTPPAEEVIAPDTLTVPENTTAPVSTGPVVAAEPAPEPPPPPPPPPPKVEEPITEATGYAAYLKNPPPDYPAFAQRQGWEGTVLLKVRVLASGKPEKVEIKQSSGRKTLDDAAVSAVKNWTFAPSKRGNTPIDGWATVPIEFKLAK